MFSFDRYLYMGFFWIFFQKAWCSQLTTPFGTTVSSTTYLLVCVCVCLYFANLVLQGNVCVQHGVTGGRRRDEFHEPSCLLPIYKYDNNHWFLWLCVCVCVCVCVLVAQSCPTLCDTVYCSPPGSSVHGVL